MKLSGATTAAALAAGVVLLAPVLIITMMSDDDKPCAGTSTTAPASPGGTSSTKVWPIKAGVYTISDVFGARGGTHKGVDLAAPADTPIYAAMEGDVVAAGPASGFGNWIIVDSNDGGNKLSTVYGHMYDKGVLVHEGDHVRAGQQIALVGSNGESSGPHLHFEVVPGGRLTGGAQIDPIPWLADAGQPDGGTAPAPSATTTPNAGQQAAITSDPNAPEPTATTTPAAPTTSPGCGKSSSTTGGGVDDLAEGKVPAEYEQWYRKAGTMCPQISSSLLAAQGEAESGFRTDAVSTSNPPALGIAQFLQGTADGAADDGLPYVRDEHGGGGSGSVWDPEDAIIGQGRYMCDIAKHVDSWIADGSVSDMGDRRILYLAAYNAGEGAVHSSHGFPTGAADYETQTRPYCYKIVARAAEFAKTLG